MNKTKDINKTKKIISVIVPGLLSMALLLAYYRHFDSLSRLALIIVMSASTFILPKKAGVWPFFRSLAFLMAILPEITFHVNFNEKPFDFTGFKAFMQVVAMYSPAFKILIPTALFVIIAGNVSTSVSNAKTDVSTKNSDGSTKNAKYANILRYIPLVTIMSILFIVSAVLNPLANICLFAFDHIAVLIINDLAERTIYKENHNLAVCLPYFILAATAFFRMS